MVDCETSVEGGIGDSVRSRLGTSSGGEELSDAGRSFLRDAESLTESLGMRLRLVVVVGPVCERVLGREKRSSGA